MCCRAIKTKLIGVAEIAYQCLLQKDSLHIFSCIALSFHEWPEHGLIKLVLMKSSLHKFYVMMKMYLCELFSRGWSIPCYCKKTQ